MLPCERTPRPPLSREEFDRQLPLLLADYVCVVRYVLRDKTTAHTHTMQALCGAVLAYQIPPLAILSTVTGWTLFAMQELRRTRALTPDETEIEAAAWRLSDAMHGPRDTY